jgi:hypothetical protein
MAAITGSTPSGTEVAGDGAGETLALDNLDVQELS